MFSLCCAMRGQPKFQPRHGYLPSTHSRLSRCGVNIRFKLNAETGIYERVVPQIGQKIVHDHKLELDDRCGLSQEAMRDIRHWWMDDPTISCSEIIKRVREASHQVNADGISLYLHLKHLDVLNALVIIRGAAGKLNLEELMLDLQQVQYKFADATVQVNTGTPTMVFVQTSDMLALHKIYNRIIMVNVSKKRKN